MALSSGYLCGQLSFIPAGETWQNPRLRIVLFKGQGDPGIYVLLLSFLVEGRWPESVNALLFLACHTGRKAGFHGWRKPSSRERQVLALGNEAEIPGMGRHGAVGRPRGCCPTCHRLPPTAWNHSPEVRNLIPNRHPIQPQFPS